MKIAAAALFAVLLPLHATAAPPPAAAAVEALLATDERPDAARARQLAATGAILLDVRSPEEWAEGHAQGARFLPFREVDGKAAKVLPDKDAPIVTYCAVGGRAAIAAHSLRQLGYTHVVSMKGGIDDLKAAGQPLEK